MPDKSSQNTENEPMRSTPGRILSDIHADLVDCIVFFSRLPVPKRLGKPSEGMPPFPRASRMLPLAGFLLGLVALAPATLFDAVALTAPLPSFLLACLTIASMVIVTGALHEDGLADVADGFWGGHTTSRKLEIMKDSRLGSYGALALVLSIAIRISILFYLFDNYGVHTGGLAYLAMATASRVPVLHVWFSLPAARINGLSARAGQPSFMSYCIGLAIGALATAGIIVPLFGYGAGVGAFVLLAGSAMLIAYLAQKHIRGQTGDVLGASQQLGEMAFGIGLLLFASAG